MPVKSRKRKKPNWNRRGWEGTRNSEAEIKELKLWAGKQYEFELNNMNIVIEHFFKLSTLSILVLNICCISPPKCSDYRITNFLFFFFFLPSFFFSAIFIFMIISGSQPYLTATLTALWNQVHYHLCKTNDRTGDSGHHWQSCLLASISHAGSWQWEEGVYQEMDSCKWLQGRLYNEGLQDRWCLRSKLAQRLGGLQRTKGWSHSRAAQGQGLLLQTQRRIHTVLWRGWYESVGGLRTTQVAQ